MALACASPEGQGVQASTPPGTGVMNLSARGSRSVTPTARESPFATAPDAVHGGHPGVSIVSDFITSLYLLLKNSEV